MTANLFSSLQKAFRSVVRQPRFSLSVILLLAVGIALSTTVFSILNAVLIRPLPFPGPDRLVTLWEENAKKGITKSVVGAANFTDWQAQSKSFDSMAAYLTWNYNFSGSGQPERISVALVTQDFFRVLSVSPKIGRAFTFSDLRENPEPVILSNGFWLRHFGGDPKIVERSVSLNGRSHPVIGVMPKTFSFPDSTVQVWVPYQFAPEELTSRTGNYLRVIGRLHDQSNLSLAQLEMNQIAVQLERRFPETNKDSRIRVIPMQEEQAAAAKPMLMILFGAVCFVLLISCSNAGNLLLARSAVKQKEQAIRTALGASKQDLVWETLLEGLILSSIAGMLALIFVALSIEATIKMIPVEIPRLNEIRIDSMVLIFTMGISLLTGVLFSTAATFGESADLHSILSSGGKSTEEGKVKALRRVFVVFQITLAVALLSGSLLLVKSLQNLNRVALGFHLRNQLTFRVWLPTARYSENKQQADFFEDFLERLRSSPAIQSAGAIQDLPLRGNEMMFPAVLKGKPTPLKGQERPIAYRTFAGDYFSTLGIPILRGGLPRNRNNSTAVVWINQSAANQFWPGENPIGQQIRFAEEDRWLTVEGIIADVKHMGPAEEEGPALYQPHSQKTFAFLSWMTVVIQTNVKPAGILPFIRAQLKEMDPNQPLYDVTTLNEIFRETTGRSRFSTFVLSLFAVLAGLLACSGIYSVIQYSVARRTREIGVRMALGARYQHVILFVLKDGSGQIVAGVIAGIALSIVASRFVRAFLFQIRPLDPLVLIASAILIFSAALFATYLPARHAAQIDPLAALRQE